MSPLILIPLISREKRLAVSLSFIISIDLPFFTPACDCAAADSWAHLPRLKVTLNPPLFGQKGETHSVSIFCLLLISSFHLFELIRAPVFSDVKWGNNKSCFVTCAHVRKVQRGVKNTCSIVGPPKYQPSLHSSASSFQSPSFLQITSSKHGDKWNFTL